MIGVLVPTRGRPAQLRTSVSGLLDLAADPAAIRVGFALDPDDHASIKVASSLARPHDIVWVASQRYGYQGLHRYVNYLATAVDPTEWLLVWNDDAVMLTAGWDQIVRFYDGLDVVLDPETDHDNEMPLFPIIPTRFVHALGHLSLSPHYDSWWDDLSNWLGIRRAVPVNISHAAYGANDDLTARESRAGRRSAEFFAHELTSARMRDARYLQAQLIQGGPHVGEGQERQLGQLPADLLTRRGR